MRKIAETDFVSLTSLKPGEKAEIISINAKGEIKKRLIDLGILRGLKLMVVRKAPLGDPIIVKISGFLLSLRKEEANKISVKYCE